MINVIKDTLNPFTMNVFFKNVKNTLKSDTATTTRKVSLTALFVLKAIALIATKLAIVTAIAFAATANPAYSTVAMYAGIIAGGGFLLAACGLYAYRKKYSYL